MDDLKAYYRGSLRNRIETLEAVKRTLDDNGGEARESIRRIAHSLEGTGVTYGFPEISEAARTLLRTPPATLAAATEALIETLRGVASSAPEDAATILLVEEDPAMIMALESKLAGPNRRIVSSRSSAAATEYLAGNQVDIILLDLVLPDEDGRNLLARLRSNPKYTVCPIIVVTARNESQPKAECYALGADEYFEKPVDLDALSSAVATKLLRAGELSREAQHDSLTGLLNRAGVQIAFERAQALAQRAGYPLSLALADLDGLKRINDTGGHALGDRVLRRVAEILTRSLRRSDRVARWGGDEFVILFPDGNPAGASRALEKVLRGLAEETFGESLRVGFSAGVTGVGKTAVLEDVVTKADRLLYLAKEAGGHRVVTSRQRPQAARKKVLLAEDDQETVAAVEQRLKEAELEVVHCADGKVALETALGSQIDLAILDVAVPGLGGLEILERLRRSPTHVETPIIMVTDEDSEDAVLAAFDMGADDYVVKPFSALELRARVCRLLKTATRRG
ncbi:MAG: response regulator [bacterium]|nr:response regulator [bacterium]